MNKQKSSKQKNNKPELYTLLGTVNPDEWSVKDGRRERRKYPFSDLDVGESFIAYIEPTYKNQANICSCAAQWKAYNNKDAKFKTKLTEKGILVTRIL